jgi:hypothetical protein
MERRIALKFEIDTALLTYSRIERLQEQNSLSN